jgi:hypothetical protein
VNQNTFLPFQIPSNSVANSIACGRIEFTQLVVKVSSARILLLIWLLACPFKKGFLVEAKTNE